MRSLALVLFGLFAGTASADTLIERAQRAEAAGKHDQAYAYAEAAIRQPGSEPEMKGARDSYAQAWVEEQLKSIGVISDANVESAFGTLAAMHQLFGPGPKVPRLDEALQYAAGLMVVRVQALADQGDFGRAEALMAAIAKAAPGHDDELAKLRARAFEARSAEAKAVAGKPAAALLHLSAAGRFGTIAADAREAAQRGVSAVTQTKRSVSVTGACFGLESKLDVSGGEGVPIAYAVEVGECAATGPTDSEGTKAVPYQKKIKQMVSKPKVVTGEDCTNYTYDYKSSNGTTVGSNTHQACHTTVSVVQGAPEEITILEPAVEDVATTTTISNATGKVHVVATWGGGTLARDLSAEGIAIGVHYHQPTNAPRPSDEGNGSVETAQGELIDKLRAKVLDVDGEVRTAIGDDYRHRAAGESDPLTAEDDLATAALISNKPSPELEALVRDRYHMGPEELASALFGKDIVIPELVGAMKEYPVPQAEIDEDSSIFQRKYFDSATGRTAVTFTFDLGYAQASAPGKDNAKSYMAGINFYWAVPIPDHKYAVVGTYFDFRAGTHGLVETRLGAGPGINFHGLLVNPMLDVGVGKFGTPDKAVEPNLQYNVAFEADAALRLGFAIPHVAAFDATFARRRRLGTKFAVENRAELAVRVRPVAVMVQYTQLSTDTGDTFGGLSLAHDAGKMLQVLVGFGL